MSTENNEEIQFVSKIELEEKFQAFIGLSNDMILFVHIDKNLENIFSLRKLDNDQVILLILNIDIKFETYSKYLFLIS